MPHLQQCLEELGRAGVVLGIVSNAQFFTRPLLEALLGRPADQWGFCPGLQFYSYQHQVAKPSTRLHALAGERLGERGIVPADVLYVGNDLLNDVTPARSVGFHTALFAGDARSLRWREGDRRVAGVSPEVVLTDLAQIGQCTMID